MSQSAGTPKQLPRTAVVVVHGMGSQRPKDTLRGLVDALWTHDPDVKTAKASEIWIKPSSDSDLFDLATVTTKPLNIDGKPRAFEFHEFYWAHQLSDTRPVAVLLWLFWLMRKGRNTANVLRSKWLYGSIILSLLVLSAVVLVVTLAAHVAAFTPNIWGDPPNTRAHVATIILTFGLSTTLMGVFGGRPGVKALLLTLALAFLCKAFGGLVYAGLTGTEWPALLSLAMSWKWLAEQFWTPVASWAVLASITVLAIYALVDGLFLTPYFGDVARYMRPAPANVMARETIQKEGVRLVERLHESQRFDRIIVVAHSLGTVVAYDVLKDAFARITDNLCTPALCQSPAFAEVDLFRSNPSDDNASPAAADWRDEWRTAVRTLSRDAAALTMKTPEGKERAVWLVSDFITLGSPLTHAAFLMTNGSTWTQLQEDFRRRRRERELPCCPPRRLGQQKRLSFKDEVTKETRIQHAALFGFVRWTNLYFRASGLGTDFIGGAVSQKDGFGTGIVDVSLTERVTADTANFAHLWYWAIPADAPEASHLVALRAAVDLQDRTPSAPAAQAHASAVARSA